MGKVLRQKGLGGRARHKEKRKRTFVFSKRQSHDVVIAFLYGDNKKIKFYQTKGEFASSYINDRRFPMEEKVEELIDIYKQQIYSLCYKLAKTKEDAEDIFQETWIKVFSSRHQLSCVENYKKWITTICVRAFYDFYRKKKRWKDRVLDLFHKEDGGEIDFADEVNISEEFIQKVEAEMIREVIQLLNEKYKTVLVLYYYEQYSYKEMSEILNIPIGTVKYRLNYAKKQMREHLEGFVYDGR